MNTSTMTAPTVQAEMHDVAGSPVALRRRGTGDPLLFLHGAGFTGRWLRFHEALARGADVIAPEHIGFGATPRQDWLETIDDLVIHYDDLRRSLELETFDLVGYSLGGWIAAAYAVTYPERLRTLTLITPIGLRIPGRPPFADLFQMEPADVFGTVFNDPTNMAEVAVDMTDLDTLVAAYEESSTLARLVWNPRYDRRLPRRLRRVDRPALIVGAENDRLVPDEACDLYASHLPDARVERIPGTGHALVIEQPERTAQTILEFIRTERGGEQ
ncbi:MAG TPA: alpha/beta hydrolase [Pseudonocardia sp.]|jgi:pimeloyl-ACP methyl ester carboxylesterase|nr:alpha/beta hydrolase [Pseudonocardia sp.]